MIKKWICDEINKFKLGSYRRRFFRLKSKILNSPDVFKKAKIKSKIEGLLSLVEKLGEAGKPLEKDIRNFIREMGISPPSTPGSIKDEDRESPPSMRELIQRSIEDREGNVVITIQPKHVKGLGMRRELLEKIQKREGRIFSSKSTAHDEHKSELPPEIRYKD